MTHTEPVDWIYVRSKEDMPKQSQVVWVMVDFWDEHNWNHFKYPSPHLRIRTQGWYDESAGCIHVNFPWMPALSMDEFYNYGVESNINNDETLGDLSGIPDELELDAHCSVIENVALNMAIRQRERQENGTEYTWMEEQLIAWAPVSYKPFELFPERGTNA